MTQQILNTGLSANDGNGDTLRGAMVKCQNNFDELYSDIIGSQVVINSESDFAIQDGTTITLEADKRYFIGTPITTTKRFIVSNGVSITSINPFSTTLTYTGVGTMFTSTSASYELRSIRVDCPNGTLFDFTDGVLLLTDMQAFSCVNVGTFTQSTGTSRSLIIQNSAILSNTGQGFQLAGTFTILSFEKFFHITSSASAISLDLGTATINNLELLNYEPFGVTGSVAISGLPNSGNIPVGVIASVRDSGLDGLDMTPLSGITNKDIRWEFSDNSGVDDSHNVADAFLLTPKTVVITVAGQYVAIGGGNWQSDVQSRFTVNTDGELTYIGETSGTFAITGTATVSKVGGGVNTLAMRIAKNLTTFAKTQSQTDNATPAQVVSQGLLTLNTGDVIELGVANLDGTADIVVDLANITITEI